MNLSVTTLFTGLFATAAALCLGTVVNAQGLRESKDSAVATRCARQSRQLDEGMVATVANMRLLRPCDRTGPLALVKLWAKPTQDRAVLTARFNLSRELVDRRMIGPLMKVAEDRTRSNDERFAALGTLGHFVEPHRVLTYVEDSNSPSGYTLLSVTSMNGARQYGEQPPTAADETAIRAFMRKFASTEKDNDLQSVAQLFVGR